MRQDTVRRLVVAAGQRVLLVYLAVLGTLVVAGLVVLLAAAAGAVALVAGVVCPVVAGLWRWDRQPEVVLQEQAPAPAVPELAVLVVDVTAPAVQRLVVQVQEPAVVLPEVAEPVALLWQDMGASRVA